MSQSQRGSRDSPESTNSTPRLFERKGYLSSSSELILSFIVDFGCRRLASQTTNCIRICYFANRVLVILLEVHTRNCCLRNTGKARTDARSPNSTGTPDKINKLHKTNYTLAEVMYLVDIFLQECTLQWMNVQSQEHIRILFLHYLGMFYCTNGHYNCMLDNRYFHILWKFHSVHS